MFLPKTFYVFNIHNTTTIGIWKEYTAKSIQILFYIQAVSGRGYKNGDTCGVMVTIVGNGHGNASSNPGQFYSHFHIAL